MKPGGMTPPRDLKTNHHLFMKNPTKSLFIAVAALGVTALTHAAEPVEPEVIGLMFYSDSCGSCKVLDPKVESVKAGLSDEAILFAKFDHSDEATKAQAAMLASALGVGDLYSEQEKASGFLLLVDAETKEPVGKLTKEMSEEDIKEAIDEAVKG